MRFHNFFCKYLKLPEFHANSVSCYKTVYRKEALTCSFRRISYSLHSKYKLPKYFSLFYYFREPVLAKWKRTRKVRKSLQRCRYHSDSRAMISYGANNWISFSSFLLGTPCSEIEGEPYYSEVVSQLFASGSLPLRNRLYLFSHPAEAKMGLEDKPPFSQG